MIKSDQKTVMRAVALCFKPFLKVEESLIYCNLSRTQFNKKVQEYGIYKTNSGYFKKEDLDRMLAGEEPQHVKAAAKMVIRLKSTAKRLGLEAD